MNCLWKVFFLLVVTCIVCGGSAFILSLVIDWIDENKGRWIAAIFTVIVGGIFLLGLSWAICKICI